MTTDPRSALSSDDRDYPPGPLAGIKRGPTSDPGYPQAQAAEVESARLLANDARQTLLGGVLGPGHRPAGRRLHRREPRRRDRPSSSGLATNTDEASPLGLRSTCNLLFRR
jgi:hypothetical protein